MNTAVARENWQGQVVDEKFPLLQWLGGSERSVVFRTQLPGPQPRVAAIKLVSAEAGNGERQTSRWQAAARLAHPHLLRLFHVGQCQINNTPLLYVVMEYTEEDLSQVLPLRALSPEEAGEMLPPLVDVLSYLHERGFVHGRIKPSNIMAVEEQLKLSSDSICALAESGSQALPASVFDAPEVARGAISRAADIWSVGVTLVRCLSQQPQVRENYNPIEQGIAQTIPEPFRHIARECLRPDPKARCTLADIRDWLRPAPPSLTVIQETKRPAHASLNIAVVSAALFLLLAFFALRWGPHGKPTAPSGQQQTATVPPQSSAHDSDSSISPPKPTAQAAVAQRVLPEVPLSARKTIQGKIRVSVRVAVNPAGEVAGATLFSPGPSRYFANLALQSSRRWKFKPAEVDGRPVWSEWILHFQFGRTTTEVVPVPTAR